MNDKTKSLPLYTSTFSSLIQDNCIYVDKTSYVYELIRRKRYCFLARPRRFGKSLLVSTLKELFLGTKDLFQDLWITKNTEYDFASYPVIHIDFSMIASETAEELKYGLCRKLKLIASTYGIELSGDHTPGDYLELLVMHLSKRGAVVLLIDEYDDPLLKHITNRTRLEEQSAVLQSFYKVVKGLDQYWRFVFITGVSRFSKTSIFSGMNNLEDLSFDGCAATLLGYTGEELKVYFTSYCKDLADSLMLDEITVFSLLKRYYNGYRFSDEESYVYNPFKTLLLQTGYLTIVDYDKKHQEYFVGYPNKEVEESLKSLKFHSFITIHSHKKCDGFEKKSRHKWP